MEDNTHLLKLLQRIAEDEKIEQPEIKVKDLSTGGANFSSRLYLATISDKTNEKCLNLFAKVASTPESFRENFTFQAYDVERIAYTSLFKKYRHLEKKRGIPDENKLVLPKFYAADSTYLQETIILEDLGSRGFSLYSRFESVDWPYASAAVTELAKYHALSFAYELENPDEFNKTVNEFKNVVFPDNEETKSSFNHSVQLAIKTVHEKNKEKIRKFLDGLSMKDFGEFYRAVKRVVLIHGDFRPSNMLYRNGDNDRTEVIPVDYQIIQSGCPLADLLYFIICGTDGPFRAKYYQALIQHYYSELSASLARLGLDVENIYPRKDFDFDLKKKLPGALIVAICILSVLTTPEDQAPNVEEFSLSVALAVQTGDLFETRLNEIVDDFVAWGVLVD